MVFEDKGYEIAEGGVDLEEDFCVVMVCVCPLCHALVCSGHVTVPSSASGPHTPPPSSSSSVLSSVSSVFLFCLPVTFSPVSPTYCPQFRQERQRKDAVALGPEVLFAGSGGGSSGASPSDPPDNIGDIRFSFKPVAHGGGALYALFNQIDTDGSGLLDIHEVRAMIKDVLKYEVTDDVFEEFFNRVDDSGDNQIRFVLRPSLSSSLFLSLSLSLFLSFSLSLSLLSPLTSSTSLFVCLHHANTHQLNVHSWCTAAASASSRKRSGSTGGSTWQPSAPLARPRPRSRRWTTQRRGRRASQPPGPAAVSR